MAVSGIDRNVFIAIRQNRSTAVPISSTLTTLHSCNYTFLVEFLHIAT